MPDAIDIYTLIPEVYRREDARRGYPLKALLSIISEQANVVKEDVDRLWDNFFVETADDWVLPYIGDLIGNIPIHNVVRGRRADISKTISYRLRKGTLPMLEELARDVTGWSVHGVAFFDILTWNQNMNHLRTSVGTLNVRDIDICDRVHTPFDSASHSVDIRPFGPAAGWHHIPKVGFFIWRLRSYELRDVQPRSVAENNYGYFFNPLGIQQHLYHTPLAEGVDELLAGEVHIAQPVRRIGFHASPKTYFGDDKSIGIRIGNSALTAEDIVCMDLSEWRQRNDGKIGVDVTTGRLSLPSAIVDRVDDGEDITVSLHYGFSADLGGGTYERRDDQTVRDPKNWALTNPDEPGRVIEVPGEQNTVQGALDAWTPDDHPRLIIHITDSRTYRETLSFNQNTINRENVQIVITASNKQRPMINGNLIVPGSGTPARLSLNGLVVEGQIVVETPDDLSINNGIDLLELRHCTLVPGIHLAEDTTPLQPGIPSLKVAPDNDRLDVIIDHCIVGPLQLPPDTRSLKVNDSIIDNMVSNISGSVSPALVSGGLNLADAVDAVGKELTVRIGSESHNVRLRRIPASIDDVAVELQQVLRSTPSGSEAFTSMRVVRLATINRLIFLYKSGARLTIDNGEAADLLGLSSISAQHVDVFVGAIIGDLSTLIERPQLVVTKKTTSGENLTSVNIPVTLSTIPANISAAATDLQAVLRALPEFGTEIFVRAIDGERLVIYSMENGVTLRFTPAESNADGAEALGLIATLPAISFDEDGIVPGPESEITNSTVMGPVYVRAIQLASNSIFTDEVLAQRRQIGCMRMSYVSQDSATPRRFRCEPDSAITAIVTEGMSEGRANQVRREEEQRVRPEFTTRRYGLPTYAQLSQDCASEILTGADNGSEMGVFNSLLQAQRQSNLHIRFKEYLPFGLEYGLIYVN